MLPRASPEEPLRRTLSGGAYPFGARSYVDGLGENIFSAACRASSRRPARVRRSSRVEGADPQGEGAPDT